MDTITNIKIANAPCSWGALEFDLEGKALAYEQVLDEIAETGYTGTELGDWGFMPTDPAELKAELKKRDLQLLGAFVPVALSRQSSHDEGVSKASKVASLMKDAGFDNAFIVLADENGAVDYRTKNAGRIQSHDRLSATDMAIFARGAENIAWEIKERFDMRTVFHHHCAGFIETPDEIIALLDATDPGLLGLCFDTGHYMFGGGNDPLSILKRYKDRVWHLHFKDFEPGVAEAAERNNSDYFEAVKNGVFCELGKGAVNFGQVKNFLEEMGYDGWIVVEQDVLPGMGNPKLYAGKNRQYLQSIGL
jgi:inosose dehydratase